MESIRARCFTMFDEVNVCVLSAVYSSWPLSRGAPLDTYGGNLF